MEAGAISNRHPKTITRVNTSELTKQLMDEKLAAVRTQMGGKKVLPALCDGTAEEGRYT